MKKLLYTILTLLFISMSYASTLSQDAKSNVDDCKSCCSTECSDK